MITTGILISLVWNLTFSNPTQSNAVILTPLESNNSPEEILQSLGEKYKHTPNYEALNYALEGWEKLGKELKKPY